MSREGTRAVPSKNILSNMGHLTSPSLFQNTDHVLNYWKNKSDSLCVVNMEVLQWDEVCNWFGNLKLLVLMVLTRSVPIVSLSMLTWFPWAKSFKCSVSLHAMFCMYPILTFGWGTFLYEERRCTITGHTLPGVCMHVSHEWLEQFLPYLPEEEEVEAVYELQWVVNRCIPAADAYQILLTPRHT